MPQLSEIRSIEALDIRESFSDGMQMVNEKSNLEIQIGHNFEKVRIIYFNEIILRKKLVKLSKSLD